MSAKNNKAIMINPETKLNPEIENTLILSPPGNPPAISTYAAITSAMCDIKLFTEIQCISDVAEVCSTRILFSTTPTNTQPEIK